jgi:integrase
MVDAWLTRERRMPIKLTNRTVEKLSTADGLYHFDNDPKASGFGVRLYPGGGKSFFIDYRINGRQRRHTIGPYPRWSADAAREEARELRKRIDRGFDPAGDKRQKREAPTVQDLVDRYVQDHVPRKALNASRLRDEHRMLAAIAARLGKHTKVVDVHGGDIADMHRKMSEANGPVRANRMLAIAGKMFAMSLVPRAGETHPWRNAMQGNPCRGIERNHEEGRERFFSQAGLAAISDALNECRNHGTAADCIRLIMTTGARPCEAMKAQWSEFDEPGYWIRPSAHVKTRKTLKLPLNPPAIELIDRLRKKQGKSPHVFPGKVPGQPVVTLYHCWRDVKRRAGLEPGARIYDLRHSFASLGAAGGMSLLIIGKLLGHSESSTTQRYSHLSDDPLREATNKIGNAIANAGRDAPVVPLPTRRRS